MGIREDYKYCEEIIRENSKTFHKAYSRLPEDKRNAVYGVYAFCRISDDLIDEEDDVDGLLEFERELDEFKGGKVVDKPVWRVLDHIFSRYEMEIEPFYQMIEGQKRDADFRDIETDEELYDYCYYVAGTVGHMILPIIARENHRKLKVVASALGRAMQITNILRDVGEDYRKGRVYIPEEGFKRHGYRKEDLSKGIIDQNFIRLWEDYATRAESLYDEVKESYHLFDRDSVEPLILSAEYYREILNKVRENGYDCINKRAYVSDYEKIKIGLKSKLKKLI